MASAVPTKILCSEATTAFKLLNGVVCLYKPLGYGMKRTMREFKLKMCQDLNEMKLPPREERVEIRRVDLKASRDEGRIPLENEKVLASVPDGSGHQLEVVKGLSYADHPLVLGRRYHPQDIKMMGTGPTSSETSGVQLFGVNNLGIKTAQRIYHSRWLRTYLVSGRFGIATDNLFHTGRIVEKSTYSNVKEHLLQRFLLSSQASHQKMAFQASGVPMDSERAFELASQGLVRPATHSHPVIYSLKLIDFKPPDFTVELKVINEEFEYLKRLIHEIGLKMHSTAVCTKIHCRNVGPFGVEDALLLKHWTVANVLENMKTVGRTLEEFGTWERSPWLSGGREIQPLEESQMEQDEDFEESVEEKSEKS